MPPCHYRRTVEVKVGGGGWSVAGTEEEGEDKEEEEKKKIPMEGDWGLTLLELQHAFQALLAVSAGCISLLIALCVRACWRRARRRGAATISTVELGRLPERQGLI